MSRIARQYKYASFFHVIVQGIGKEEIFKKKRYINEYLNLIKRYVNELNLDIVAYCIMTNHAHLLIRTGKIEKISKLMQKVNSIYARYYNYMENGRVGYVFRDRFVSEPIDSKTYLINCIKYIHMNPVKARIVSRCSQYKFSSYNMYVKYLNNCKEDDILSKEDYINICNNNKVEQDFYDVDRIDLKEKIYRGIDRYIVKEQVELWEIFSKRNILENLIRYLKNIEKIKYVTIRKYLEINKGIMEGILENIRKK